MFAYVKKIVYLCRHKSILTLIFMKKAVLVTFSVKTRVVIDVTTKDNEDFADEEYLNAALVAREKILQDPSGYLCMENVEEIIEDTECPYGSILGD